MLRLAVMLLLMLVAGLLEGYATRIGDAAAVRTLTAIRDRARRRKKRAPPPKRPRRGKSR